jgi:hypothetical protein
MTGSGRAGDHVVDHRVKHVSQVKGLVDASERAKHIFKMTEYQGMNVSPLLLAHLDKCLYLSSIPSCIPDFIANEHSQGCLLLDSILILAPPVL